MSCLRLHPLSQPCSVNIQSQISNGKQPQPQNNTIKPQTFQPGSEDIFSNALILLRTSIHEKNPKLGSCIHAKTLKLGLESDVFIANSILNMYVKCGQVEDAETLFECMPHRTVVTWTSMFWGYSKRELADEALALFTHMLEILQPNEFTLAVVLQACAKKGDWRLVQVFHSYAIKYGFMVDDFLRNSFMDAYVKCMMVEAAEKLLEGWQCRDVVSWTSVISGCVGNGMVERGVALFFRMQEDGVLPNEVTILSVLKACSELKISRTFQWVHGLILKAGWSGNASVLNSLVEMYSMNEYFSEGAKLFCNFCFTGEGLYFNPETMASLIQGCAQSNSLRLGAEIHGYLIKNGFFPCTFVENSIMDMYSENADYHLAFQLFTRISSRDIISWNTMIRCFVNNGQPSEALNLLGEIHHNGSEDNIFPDFVTMLTSLQACSNMASLLQGQVIHSYITKTGLLHDTFIQNSLIDMYAKSGQLDFAKRIFKEMSERDLGSWNSLIAAHGIHGNGSSALQTFSKLKRSESCKPNAITFTNVLSACGHAGLVGEGLEIFYCMKREYGVEPSQEHFACIVYLLGRSGRIEEAEAFVEKMPLKAGADVWGALLGACVLFNNIKIAEKAANVLATLEPNSTVWRVALSNVYANSGRWNEVTKIRAELQGSEQLKKDGGWSSLNLKGCTFRFVAGDTKHSKSVMIYEVLNGLHTHLRDPIAAAECRQQVST